VAQESLRLSGAAASLAQVEQLLWDTALRIENGQVPLALEQLRQLEKKLQNALANRAPEHEVDRLMSELQQALERYLKALEKNSTRPPPDQSLEARTVTSRDLQRMLDQARQLARAGAREQAQALLSQLEGMLENLRMRGRQSGPTAAQQTMRGMRDLMQRQQKLLDRSLRAEQQGAPDSTSMGEQPTSNGQVGDAAGEQEALRKALGDMMRKLGERTGNIPQNLSRAERSMGEAGEALRAGQPGSAIEPQTDALDQLQQAAREIARQMQQQSGRGSGGRGDDPSAAAAGDEPGERMRRDPLGRPLPSNGAYDDGNVKIPDWNTLEESRKILDELRHRAGESFRPTLELDYINRPLQQF
jgi:tetratricopeptide (TPR) repeat protein